MVYIALEHDARCREHDARCRDDDTYSCNDYSSCGYGMPYYFYILITATVLSTFIRCCVSMNSRTLKYLLDLDAKSSAHGSNGALQDLSRYVNTIKQTPVHAIVEIRAYHHETRTEHYTDSNGKRKTRTKTVKVTTFSNDYDITQAVVGVDATRFTGEDVLALQHQDAVSPFVAFDSKLDINPSHDVDSFMRAWANLLEGEGGGEGGGGEGGGGEGGGRLRCLLRRETRAMSMAARCSRRRSTMRQLIVFANCLKICK